MSTPIATTALTLLNCWYAQNPMATTDFLYWPRSPDAEILQCRSMSTPALSVWAVGGSWHEECPGGCKENTRTVGTRNFLSLRVADECLRVFSVARERKGKANQNSQKWHRNFQPFLGGSIKLCINLDFHRRFDDAHTLDPTVLIAARNT